MGQYQLWVTSMNCMYNQMQLQPVACYSGDLQYLPVQFVVKNLIDDVECPVPPPSGTVCGVCVCVCVGRLS